MEKVLLETYFVRMTLDVEKAVIRQDFLENSDDIKEEEFYQFMEEYVNHILELYGSKQVQIGTLKTLVNISRTDFIVPPKLQEKIDKELLSKLEGTEGKIAFIQSKDLFVNTSVQQLMDEEFTQNSNKQYFDNEEQALEWLMV